jgi:hypothetical protein
MSDAISPGSPPSTDPAVPAGDVDQTESPTPARPSLGYPPLPLGEAIAAVAPPGTAAVLRREGRIERPAPHEVAGDVIFGSEHAMDSILGRRVIRGAGASHGLCGGDARITNSVGLDSYPILGPGKGPAFRDECPHALPGSRRAESIAAANGLPSCGTSGSFARKRPVTNIAGDCIGRFSSNLSDLGLCPAFNFTAGDSGTRERKMDWARRLWIGGWLFVACCLAYACSPWANHGPTEAALRSAMAPGSTGEDFATKNIEDLRVGDRVIADNPEISDAQQQESDPDPASLLRLTLRMAQADGGTLDFELLRPRKWVKAQGAKAGHAIQMDLPEMGATGPARVLAIGPCPAIEPGPGRVVTGTFAHSAANVVDVRLVGLDEPIGCTANHPFWSEDRHAFVSAGELNAGERLRTAAGAAARVAEIKPRPAAERVYNLEVDLEHTYYVSRLGVLVHNTCNVSGGAASAESAMTQAENYLGPGYKEIAPGVSRSAKGARQFRMTTSDLVDPRQGPLREHWARWQDHHSELACRHHKSLISVA